MPVEIRELIIKAYVDNSGNNPGPTPSIASNRNEMVQDSVEDQLEQVMEIINNKNER
jgi:hypothetical protein